MKKLGLAVIVCLVVSAGAQEKPRVFVQGKGSQDVTSNPGQSAAPLISIDARPTETSFSQTILESKVLCWQGP